MRSVQMFWWFSACFCSFKFHTAIENSIFLQLFIKHNNYSTRTLYINICLFCIFRDDFNLKVRQCFCTSLFGLGADVQVWFVWDLSILFYYFITSPCTSALFETTKCRSGDATWITMVHFDNNQLPVSEIWNSNSEKWINNLHPSCTR